VQLPGLSRSAHQVVTGGEPVAAPQAVAPPIGPITLASPLAGPSGSGEQTVDQIQLRERAGGMHRISTSPAAQQAV